MVIITIGINLISFWAYIVKLFTMLIAFYSLKICEKNTNIKFYKIYNIDTH